MKFKTYFREVYKELVNKVSWPTWKELQNSAVTVMVASAIIATMIFLIDLAFENIMQQVYRFIS